MDTHSSGPEDLLEQAIEGVIGPGVGHRVELLKATNSEEFVDVQTLLEEELDKLQPVVDKGVGHGVLQRRFLGVKKKRINSFSHFPSSGIIMPIIRLLVYKAH